MAKKNNPVAKTTFAAIKDLVEKELASRGDVLQPGLSMTPGVAEQALDAVNPRGGILEMIPTSFDNPYGFEALNRAGRFTDPNPTPRTIKGQGTAQKNLLAKSPGYRYAEDMAQGNTLMERMPLNERKVLQPEDLQGTTLMGHMGDNTATDVRLTRLAGVDLDEPVVTFGGVDYPLSNLRELTADPEYWASMSGASARVANKADGLMAMLDAPVTAVSMSMGKQGNYFNQAFADALYQATQKLRPDPDAVERFDEKLRELTTRKPKKGEENEPQPPKWLGLNHPKARDQLLGINGMPADGAGKLRGLFTALMSQKGYINQGFPNVKDLEAAFIKPELADASIGDVGYTMGSIEGELAPNVLHPSYNTSILGEYKGGLERQIPAEVMFYDAFGQLEGAMTNPKKGKPRLLTYAEKVNSIANRKDLFQVADQQWVDRVSQWLRENPGKGLNAAIMAIGIPQALQESQDEQPQGLINNF